MTIAVISGLFIGILFGFALQRGRFCMNSAIRDLALLQDNTLMKAVGIAVLVQMFGFPLLSWAGLITPSPKPLFWGANLVGGIVFGIGMVLAGGCASGVTYRVGEGVVAALSAVIGLAAAGTITAMGFLKPVMSYLQTNTKIMVGEASPTLANIFGLPYEITALVLSLVLGAIWLFVAMKNKEEVEASEGSLTQRIFVKGWTWLPTGIVIGIIGILAYWSSASAGRNYSLAITSGWITFVKKYIVGVPDTKIGWDAWLIVGIILGALVASLIAGEFKIRWPGWKTILQTLGGGLLMGFGAVTSAGCNVTHILSGLPLLSFGSLLGSISIALGAWLMAYLIFVRPNQA
ncbi:MAG: YeeE/YedE family protein [Anaerolineales bacterium]|nr:YeeE/YedE family protein [Anaerolineales bacterium]